MRIISGKLRGAKLFMVKSIKTRPLKDLVRESIFNLIEHSNKFFLDIKESDILDLYSGTGSFGLESLSRGAKNVYFVENDKSAFIILKKNIKKLEMEKKTKIIFKNAESVLKKKNLLKKSFNLIFCDPPFKNKNINDLIELIYKNGLLNKNGLILLHRSNKNYDDFPTYFKILDERNYGNSKIIFGKLLP